MDFLIFALPVLFLALGFPIFMVLMVTAAVSIVVVMDMPGQAIHQAIFGSLGAYSLLSVPFFLFAGEVMAKGSMSKRIIDWVMSLLGKTKGGLGFVTLGSSTFFGAISGSSVGTVAGIGRLVYPPMQKEGYGPHFGTGLLSSSAAIAQLIPPSIVLILYGISSQQSITKLFVAGILPGLVLALVLGAYIYYYSRKNAAQSQGESFSLIKFWRESRRVILAIFMPIFVLGGIYAGIFSPTEAAGIACVYAIIVSCVIYRDVSMHELWDIAVSSMYTTAQILIIVAAAGLFSWVLTVNGVPAQLSGWVSGMDIEKWQILLLINLMLLLVGCFMDTMSATLLFSPLLLPIATSFGIDPIHLGIIITMNLSIGLFTPPFGINIFMVNAITGVGMKSIFQGVLPFVLVSLVALLLVTFIPSLSLALIPFLS